MKYSVSALLFALAWLQGVSARIHDKDCRRPSNWWTRSAKTCEEIISENSVPNVEFVGSGAICQTATPLGACQTATYSRSVEICQSLGMRLCRFDHELPLVAQCRLGRRRFWYENPCNTGNHMSGERSNNNPSVPRCSDDANTFSLVCCADSETTYEVGNECAKCPPNAYRDENGGQPIIGSSSCKCKEGYVPRYANNDLASCERSTDSQFSSCPEDKFASRTANQCDGPNGLIATRGYVDKGTFCAASYGAMDGTTCPPDNLNSWFDADSYCAAAGARLCTSEEMINKAWKFTNTPECRNIRIGDEVATSTKCTQDGSKALVWTRTSPRGGQFSCKPKEITRRMSILCCADHGTQVQCLDCPRHSTASGASTEDECTCTDGRSGKSNMCTAPEDPPQLRPPPTCDVNKYLFTPSDDQAGAKAGRRRGFRSVVGFTPMVNGFCQNGKTKSEAEAICSLQGARLCTADELYRRETRGTGCGFDRLYVWSSTPCCTAEGTCDQEKYMVVVGKGKGNFYDVLQKCEAATTRFNTRCCKDVNVRPRCRSCPANSESPAASTSITQCSCKSGYWGANGGECVQS